MQQNAEQIIGEQSNNQPVLSTNSVDIPGLSNESANVSTENAENAPQHKNRPFWMKRNGNGNYGILILI